MISETLISSPSAARSASPGPPASARCLSEALQRRSSRCARTWRTAPVLVFEDCDLDVAVRETIIAKFRNTGQSCIAANRIYVQKSIHRDFVERFAAAVHKLKTGPGLEPGMDVGPLINEAAVQGALEQINDAVAKGARLLAGGKDAGLRLLSRADVPRATSPTRQPACAKRPSLRGADFQRLTQKTRYWSAQTRRAMG